MMKRFLIAICALLSVIALGVTAACTTPDEPPVTDYGTLSISDITLEEGSLAAINPTFTKDEHAITYSFESDCITITRDQVTAIKPGEVTVTAKTAYHEVTFTVTVTKKPIDYGTLSVENVEGLQEGESATISATFSIADKAEPITYTFDGEDIAIEGGVVTALKGGKTITVTATTSHHEVTFTVTTVEIDYGTLTVSSVNKLVEGNSSKIFTSFSKPEYAGEIVYSFDGDAIKIENGVVTALRGGEKVTVTARTSHHETTFTVSTEIHYGTLTISDATAWLGYPAVDFYPVFEIEANAEKISYSYDQTGIEIDAEKNLITPKKEGTYTVTAITAHHSARFTVTVNEVDTTHSGYEMSERYDYKSETRLNKWKSDGTDGSTTVFIGDSFFDYSECWPDFDVKHYPGKDALCIGISGSKTYHWEVWADGWLAETKPKNIVMHIGTNNMAIDNNPEVVFDSLKRMFTIMHDNLPDTKIYWFSITRMGYEGAAAEAQNAIRDGINAYMKEWCEPRDYITYVHTVDSITPDMLKDKVHPKLEHYGVFVDALDKAGIEINDLPKERMGLEMFSQGYGDTNYDKSSGVFTGGVEFVAPYRMAAFMRKDGEFYGGNFLASGEVEIIPSKKEHLKSANYWVGLFVNSEPQDNWYSENKALPLGVMTFKGLNYGQVRGYYANINNDYTPLGKIEGSKYEFTVLAYDGTVIIGVNGDYIVVTDKAAFTKTYFAISSENCLTRVDFDFVTDDGAVKTECERIIANQEVAAREISDISFAKSDTIGKNGKAFPEYMGATLKQNYIITGKLDITDSDKSKQNGQKPHIHFGFATSTTNRLLLNDTGLNGVYKLGLPYDYSDDRPFTKQSGKPLTIEWKVVKTDNDAFVWLNGELRVVFTALPGSDALLLGSEWNECKFYDMKAITLLNDENEYNEAIKEYSSLITQYGSETAVKRIRI